VSERPTTGSLIWRVSMKWRAAVDRAVEPLGLTHAQYSLLASLYGRTRTGETPSQRQLAEHSGLDPIYVSKLIRALERAGLVTRTADPDDSRAVRLALTPHGEAVARQAIEVVHDLLEELTAPIGGLGGDADRRLNDLLQQLLGEQPGPTKGSTP
jgi:DNA-binding MarR family transcriptional regulator